ncbi:MAG: GAF domain-containing protein [Erysipelotrichia bacterium]|nr:GAF domain-containing protein [Erysipelotrichia bacterium]NCC54267.1 GAF domain-containing protein [Erysipelotrichia bacterium]
MNESTIKQYACLIEDEHYEITILANTSAFLHHLLPDVSWTGFYLYHEDALILATFQGKVACSRIPLERGVCGYCATKKKSIIVDDVHTFADHIACDSASNSEIVIPLLIDGQLYGVLDIDSTSFARFTKQDEQFLQAICNILIQKLKNIKHTCV